MGSTIALIICIFVSVWMGFMNFGLLFRKQAIPAFNILLMSGAFTGIITHLIGLW